MADRADQKSSAEIIPFPHRLAPPVDAGARLDRALRALDQANAELRGHISDWRRSIGALTVGLGEITESLRILDTELTTVSSQLQHSGDEEPERK